MHWNGVRLVQRNKVMYVDMAALDESFVKIFSSPFHLLKLVRSERWL